MQMGGQGLEGRNVNFLGYSFGILVVCDFALVFALAPISPLFCHFFALALALYFNLGEIEGKGKGKKVT